MEVGKEKGIILGLGCSASGTEPVQYNKKGSSGLENGHPKDGTEINSQVLTLWEDQGWGLRTRICACSGD